MLLLLLLLTLLEVKGQQLIRAVDTTFVSTLASMFVRIHNPTWLGHPLPFPAGSASSTSSSFLVVGLYLKTVMSHSRVVSEPSPADHLEPATGAWLRITHFTRDHPMTFLPSNGHCTICCTQVSLWAAVVRGFRAFPQFESVGLPKCLVDPNKCQNFAKTQGNSELSPSSISIPCNMRVYMTQIGNRGV